MSGSFFYKSCHFLFSFLFFSFFFFLPHKVAALSGSVAQTSKQGSLEIPGVNDCCMIINSPAPSCKTLCTHGLFSRRREERIIFIMRLITIRFGYERSPRRVCLGFNKNGIEVFTVHGRDEVFRLQNCVGFAIVDSCGNGCLFTDNKLTMLFIQHSGTWKCTTRGQ